VPPGTLSGHVAVPDGQIYFEQAGEGPALVLISSVFLDCREWDPQFSSYSVEHTVVRYDVRGRGRSTGDRSKSLDSEDLAALLDHLGLRKAVVLGNSVGGGIACEFAAGFPGRATGLILVAGGPNDLDPTPEEESQFRESFPEGEGRLGELIKAGRKAEAIEKILDLWAPRVPAPERERLRQITAENYDRFVEFRNAEGGRRPDFPIASQLAKAGIPLLAIAGAHDNPADKMMLRRFARSVPTALHVELAEGDHTASISARSEFDRVVSDFLDRIAKGEPWPPTNARLPSGSPEPD